MNWFRALPAWLKEIGHLWVAVLIFCILLATWIYTRERDILQMVAGAFGVIATLLTGRALAGAQQPPTEESVKTLTVTERRTDPPAAPAEEKKEQDA